MTISDIINLRLHNQAITPANFSTPGEVVAWFGAMQAQMYLDSLWAIGLRMQTATESVIEQAVADKTIVRTWPMRGTLHFVAADDVRWMLKLLTPRIVNGPAAYMYKQLELGETDFTKCKKIFGKALQGGKQLKREAMYELLEAQKIATANMRGLHILSRLSQDAFLCFGRRAGKQPTFALLDEWIPTSKNLVGDEALCEIARRYFVSHGPATLQDFAWWTGLPMAAARTALALAAPQLAQEIVAEKTYWFSPASRRNTNTKNEKSVFLLPAFDEYTVAYKDRSAVIDPAHTKKINTGNGVFSPIIVIDGQVVGAWKRTLKKNAVQLTPDLFTPLKKSQAQALTTAAHRYGAFLETAVI